MIPIKSQKSEYCQFCGILSSHLTTKRLSQKIINQNQEFFAFQDHQKSAQQHILVCTKQHIESALHVKQIEQLKRMETFGLETLRKITKRPLLNAIEQTRFRFHLPPFISEFHIHLHCFVLPFISKDKQIRIFGHMAKSVDQVICILRQKQLEKRKLKEKNPQIQEKCTFKQIKPRL